MKRADEATKKRLHMLDAATGYAGFVDLQTPEDRKLLRLGWVAKKPSGTYRITRNGRAALKRYAGRTSYADTYSRR